MKSFNNLSRSIKTCNPTKQLYYPEHFNPEESTLLSDLEALTSSVDHRQPNHNRWYQYADDEDLDFTFGSKNNASATRFSDGSFPVWYGCFEPNAKATSVAEVSWHSIRQAQKDLMLCKVENTIFFEYAFCKAHIQNEMLYSLIDSHEFDDTIAHCTDYQSSQKLGNKIKNEGYFGLIYRSRRHTSGINCGIFHSSSILSSKVVSYWSLEVEKSGNAIYCKEQNILFSDDGWLISNIDV